MENDMPAKQPPAQKSNVGRVAVSIAVILFFIGLFLYVSSSPQQQTIPESTPRDVTKVVPTSGSTPKATRVEGQIIVKFKEGISDKQINDRLRPLNASIKSEIEGIKTTVVSVPPGQEDAILKELADDPIVQYVEPDYIYYLQFTPTDPDFGKQWSLVNTGQTINNKKGTVDADIDAELAWDVTKGTGVKVAILDSGIDATHPELTGKVVGSKIFTTNSIVDINGHGTHVAGILAANANNGQGISGVCPECQLLIGKITNDDEAGSVPGSAIAPGITWAADNGAQVINMSIAGTSFSQAVQDAVNYAWGKNVVIVAAAGNDGNTVKHYPAAYTNVVSVANTNSNDQRSSTSDFGTWVQIAAPGDTIYSTLPTTPNLRDITGYAYMNGTSMASPAVAGVAALIWKTPFGTNNTAVVQRLYSTADKIAGTGTNWVNGRVNAAKAVGAGTTPAPSAVPSVNPSSVQPTFVCGGSTNNICEPSPTISIGISQNPNNPSGTVGTPGPSGTNPQITPPANPGNPGNPGLPGHHRHGEGAISRFVAFLLALFAAIVKFLLSIFPSR